MNRIISKISPKKLRNAFSLGLYEFLEKLEGKTWEGPFFKVQSDRITVWSPQTQQHERQPTLNKTLFKNKKAFGKPKNIFNKLSIKVSPTYHPLRKLISDQCAQVLNSSDE